MPPATPEFSCCKTVRSGCCRNHSLVPSVLPLSTTTISSGRLVCERRISTHCRRTATRLKVITKAHTLDAPACEDSSPLVVNAIGSIFHPHSTLDFANCYLSRGAFVSLICEAVVTSSTSFPLWGVPFTS